MLIGTLKCDKWSGIVNTFRTLYYEEITELYSSINLINKILVA